MGIPIHGKDDLYIETGPRFHTTSSIRINNKHRDGDGVCLQGCWLLDYRSFYFHGLGVITYPCLNCNAGSVRKRGPCLKPGRWLSITYFGTHTSYGEWQRTPCPLHLRKLKLLCEFQTHWHFVNIAWFAWTMSDKYVCLVTRHAVVGLLLKTRQTQKSMVLWLWCCVL